MATKSNSGAILDEWQSLAANTVGIGTPLDISASFESSFQVEVALTNANAQQGVEILVEVSNDGTKWTEYQRYTGTAITPTTTGLTNTEAVAATVLEVTDISNFAELGQKWFIINSTVAESESVRTVVDNGSTQLTVADGLQFEQDASAILWNTVDEWVVTIFSSMPRARISILNEDANASVHWTIRRATTAIA